MTDSPSSPSSSTPYPDGPHPGPELGPTSGPQTAAEDVPQLSAKRRRVARVRAWAAGRERRIAAGVAAVALVGAAGGVALTVVHGGHGRDHERAMNWSEDGPGSEGGKAEHGGDGRQQGEHGHRHHGG
ncbi:hypothetical protein AB0O00_25960, partial [Kitasatospora sp. NPDC093558]